MGGGAASTVEPTNITSNPSKRKEDNFNNNKKKRKKKKERKWRMKRKIYEVIGRRGNSTGAGDVMVGVPCHAAVSSSFTCKTRDIRATTR